MYSNDCEEFRIAERSAQAWLDGKARRKAKKRALNNRKQRAYRKNRGMR